MANKQTIIMVNPKTKHMQIFGNSNDDRWTFETSYIESNLTAEALTKILNESTETIQAQVKDDHDLIVAVIKDPDDHVNLLENLDESSGEKFSPFGRLLEV